jgi:TRAP-type C4-dicarboxylate transport system substrate-binding protein
MVDAVKLVDSLKKEGAKFSNVDTAAFQKETASVYDLWEKELGAFVPQLKKAADEAAK